MFSIRKTAPRAAILAGTALTALMIVAAPLAAAADESHYDGQLWEAEMARIQHGVQPSAVLDARTQSSGDHVTRPGFNYVAPPTLPAGTPIESFVGPTINN